MEKFCKKCKELKDVSSFYRAGSSTDGLMNWCKNCVSENAHRWRANRTPEEKKLDKQKQRQKIKAKAEGTFTPRNRPYKDYFGKYGITAEIYKEMLVSQGHKCKICSGDASSFKRKLAVDHCHLTGKVRGLLCTACNQLLGFAKDSTLILESAIKYLSP